MVKKNLANIVTVTRIISTIVLVFSKVYSLVFIIAYIYAGLSDVIDGFVARKLHIESDIGRKLDSISDLSFYTVMMIKVWPLLVRYLPDYMWNILWIIVGIRASLYIYTSLRHHELLSNHTIFNKATGALLFLLPFMILSKEFVIYAAVVETVALIAAIYEIFEIVKK